MKHCVVTCCVFLSAVLLSCEKRAEPNTNEASVSVSESTTSVPAKRQPVRDVFAKDVFYGDEMERCATAAAAEPKFQGMVFADENRFEIKRLEDLVRESKDPAACRLWGDTLTRVAQSGDVEPPSLANLSRREREAKIKLLRDAIAGLQVAYLKAGDLDGLATALLGGTTISLMRGEWVFPPHWHDSTEVWVTTLDGWLDCSDQLDGSWDEDRRSLSALYPEPTTRVSVLAAALKRDDAARTATLRPSILPAIEQFESLPCRSWDSCAEPRSEMLGEMRRRETPKRSMPLIPTPEDAKDREVMLRHEAIRFGIVTLGEERGLYERIANREDHRRCQRN